MSTFKGTIRTLHLDPTSLFSLTSGLIWLCFIKHSSRAGKKQLKRLLTKNRARAFQLEPGPAPGLLKRLETKSKVVQFPNFRFKMKLPIVVVVVGIIIFSFLPTFEAAKAKSEKVFKVKKQGRRKF